MSHHTVPASSAVQVLSAPAARAHAARLRDEARLDPQELADPSRRIALAQLVALYEAAARVTRDATFGLTVGARTRPRVFGILGHLLPASPSLGEALGRIERYFPLWTAGATLRLERDGDTVALRWRYVDPAIGECRQDCEMTLATIATNLRRLLPRNAWRPREVHFEHGPPRDAAVHARVFGAPVRFRMPTNALVLDEQTFTAPIGAFDPELSAALVAYAEERLEATARDVGAIERARKAILERLRGGDTPPDLAGIARASGVGARTLQRRLTDEGTSFRALVTATRRQLAEQLLVSSELGVSEIAYQLGYTHPSELHRAFRAWHGVSPRQWRLHRRGEAGRR